MWLDRAAKLLASSISRSASNSGWRVCWIEVFSISMRSNRISPTSPMSVLEISVSSFLRVTSMGRRSASHGRFSRFITSTAT